MPDWSLVVDSYDE